MSIRLHTPGPWTVDYTDDNLRIYVGDLLIAEVNGSTEHIEVRGLDEETTEANAWLIAAAPDLLAALERILAWISTEGESPNTEIAKGLRRLKNFAAVVS